MLRELSNNLFVVGGLLLVLYGTVFTEDVFAVFIGAVWLGWPLAANQLIYRPLAAVARPRITRDTDLREVAYLEDPVTRQVERDLARLNKLS